MLEISGNLASTVGKKNPFRYRGYYYDSETEMYYLQSRYYDPEVKRFINADKVAVLFIQQGSLLQYNQYAYCFNNPIKYLDVEGYIPQAVEDKMVHNWVLDEICKINPDLVYEKTCIYYNGKDRTGKWGYCDLYNSKTGEVWELKKNSTSPSCTTANASAQLNKYINGRLKSKLDKPLKLPCETYIPGGYFTKKRNGYTYEVNYWNEGKGILRYTYMKQKTPERELAETAAVIVLGGFALFCSMTTGIPVYI